MIVMVSMLLYMDFKIMNPNSIEIHLSDRSVSVGGRISNLDLLLAGRTSGSHGDHFSSKWIDFYFIRQIRSFWSRIWNQNLEKIDTASGVDFSRLTLLGRPKGFVSLNPLSSRIPFSTTDSDSSLIIPSGTYFIRLTRDVLEEQPIEIPFLETDARLFLVNINSK